MRITYLSAALIFAAPAPLWAQHAGHDMQAPPPAEKSVAPVDQGPMEDDNMPDTVAEPAAMDHSQMNHANSDREAMQDAAIKPAPIDHNSMDHSQMNHAMPMASEMPPPSAGSGPPTAADAIWGAEAMREARREFYNEHGGMETFWVMADRAEYRARQGKDGYLWDLQGYYGGDINKFWFKSEGEGSFGEPIEDAEIQALYSRAIAPFFDLQAGVRQDLTGPERTHAVVGIQGLVPYMFELDGAAFLSNKGDLTARIEAEYDQRITQRLILQPRAEVNLSAQDIPELGIGAGFDTVELGMRLRYEIAREFAPYIGIEQEWKLGDSRDFARADGEDPSVTNYVVGVRFWF